MIGVLAGLSCYLLVAALVLVTGSFAIRKKASIRVYGFVTVVSASLHAVGTLLCVMFIDLSGWQLVLYALVMISFTVYTWVIVYKQLKIYKDIK